MDIVYIEYFGSNERSHDREITRSIEWLRNKHNLGGQIYQEYCEEFNVLLGCALDTFNTLIIFESSEDKLAFLLRWSI